MAKGPLARKYEKLLVFGAISTRPPADLVERIRNGDAEAVANYYVAVQTMARAGHVPCRCNPGCG